MGAGSRHTSSPHTPRCRWVFWMLCIFHFLGTFGWALQTPSASFQHCSPFGDHGFVGHNGKRIGEASHPGPAAHPFQLRISTSNPGGLRGKEEHLMDLGPGIHQLSETHLSSITCISSAKRCKYLAQQMNRRVSLTTGHPAALRTGSDWAGTWTGVATLSDFPKANTPLSWPTDIWATGRVQCTTHFIGQHRLLLVNLYGFPRGPTWPAAKQLNHAILNHVTQHIILGYDGLAAISGDFNMDPLETDDTRIWLDLGWQEVQTLASDRWQHTVMPTCKGKTQRDQIWVSPALAERCTHVEVKDIFLGHSTVIASFDWSLPQLTFLAWPRPTPIPWEDIDTESWQTQAQATSLQPQQDSTEFYRNFGKQFEQSLHGHYTPAVDGKLPEVFQGRASRTKPQLQHTSPLTSRASRSGEASLHYGLPGRAVLAWYKQLRRLQSLKHSVHSDKQTAEAILYRVELWRSIKHAPGYKPSFPEWWKQQTFAADTGPLPECPPNTQQMDNIYFVYEGKFREFEAWHHRQRRKQLQLKYDRTCKQLFQDLRPPSKPQIHHIVQEDHFEILAVSEDGNQIHIDHPPTISEHDSWSLDGLPLQVTQVDDVVLTVATDHPIDAAAALTQQQHIVQTNQLQQKLEQFWHTRWYKTQAPSASDWQRITNFMIAYMPKGSFSFPTLTPQLWRQSAKRFREMAARGPDAFNKADLLHMNDSQVEAVLSLFQALESRQTQWPEQLLTSFAVALAKKADASQINDFRPIILLSILYRNWASLRSRQFLRQMICYTPEEALGYMPGCETFQLWLVLQATIEQNLIQNKPFCGLSTDIVKAFEHIGRPQLFALLNHIGAPDSLTHPWASFLDSFHRRFLLRNQVGRPCFSNVGLPEGCPLSVAGMAALDWALHTYQRIFAPAAHTQSFVDNISITAHTASAVIAGYFAVKSFFEAWGMTLDDHKTYTWATHKQLRQEIGLLGFATVQHAMELGGNMVFGKANRNSNFLDGGSMDDAWDRLRRSPAPHRLKLMSLPAVFWSKALHGAAGCVFAPTHLKHLRTRALQSLGVHTAGANALLRLSLSLPHTADPGFFQLYHTLADLRRICHKTPALLQQWQSFMVHFGGTRFPGPFSKLIQILGQIGWSVVSPPWLRDHDGNLFDVLRLDHKGLLALLRDGWLQYVAHSVTHRKSMADLRGLDPDLVMLDKHSLTALDFSRLLALQEGAFLSPWAQAKFDSTKKPVCTLCSTPDTQQHWLVCPRFASLRTDEFQVSVLGQHLPESLKAHLLPSRSPWAVPFKQYFMDLDPTVHWVSSPGEGTQHLFVDGSCFDNGISIATCAAWGVTNATTGRPVSTGHLHGFTQSIGRAELVAACVALRWGLIHHCTVWLWTDSKYVAGILHRLLDRDPSLPSFALENHDLIEDLWHLTQEYEPEQLKVTWIPSHLDAGACTTDYEDWVACWNHVVDRQAVLTNRQRPPHFWQMVDEARAHHEVQAQQLRLLRAFYTQIADTTQGAAVGMQQLPIEVLDDTDWSAHLGDRPLWQQLPCAWTSSLELNSKDPPSAFIELVMDIFARWDTDTLSFSPISFLELALLIKEDPAFRLPKQSEQGDMQLYRPSEFFSRPTLARVVDLLRRSVRVVVKTFGLDVFLLNKIDRSHLGIRMPVDCMLLRIDPALTQQIPSLIDSFTAHRGFRKAADLAKPF